MSFLHEDLPPSLLSTLEFVDFRSSVSGPVLMANDSINRTEVQEESCKGWSRTVLIATIYYLVIVLGVGVPIWIKTTTPVRYPLPDISNLMVHSQMISHKVHITVVVTDPQVFTEDYRSSLRQQLSGNWPRKTSSDGSSAFIFEWKVRPVVPEEQIVLDTQHTILGLDNELGLIETHAANGRIWIYLLDNKYLGDSQPVAYGSHRFVYMTQDESEDRSLAEKIVSVVDVLLEPTKILETDLQVLTGPDVVKATPDILVDPEIEVYVNFILEDPKDGPELQKQDKFKDVQQLIHGEFVMRSGIRQLLDIRISTQMVYYAVDSEFLSSLTTESVDGKRLIQTKDMPLLMTSIESRIVEPHNRQSYNLHVMIPSSKSSSILFSDGDSQSNLIMAASRGAFVVWNDPLDFNLGLKVFMRSLMGLNQVMLHNSIRSDIFFSKWELDYVMRSASQKQVLKTLASLESVEKLLGKMSNMVIEEDVSRKMTSAVDLSHTAIDDLASGRLETAYVLSSKAYILSESAFFDPSLLALLYFPEDQKYAVYFPLFLPISLPVLSSIFYMVKYFVNLRRKIKTE